VAREVSYTRSLPWFMISEGPVELGRGVVVLPGHQPPVAWKSCPRVVVGDAALRDPGPVVADLHRYWIERRPAVVELGLDPTALRAPERCHRPVYELTPSFEFGRERLQFLVWANNYDARGGDSIWWHGRKAARHFAGDGVREGGAADIILADGTPMFIDGGPPQPSTLPSKIGVVHRWNAEAGRLQSPGQSTSSSELKPDQLAAVRHRTGAARVIAPAGSGKTRVLTERLRHLVGDRGVHPGTVTALAYNTKAAGELKERCRDIKGSEKLNIRTLNSFGWWICNEFGSAGQLRVLEEPAQRELLQRHIEIRRQSNTDTVAPYLAALSSIRLGLTSPEATEEANPDASGIAQGFEPYRAALAEAGGVDFDEQIYQAIEILLTNPDARSVAQSKCRHLLVDEFQDLNPAHLLLIRLLAAPAYDCFGVGDDDQVIYGYSGATPEFLINFARYFPGAGAHDLKVNYRCPPAVIDAARHLLSYNARRIEKTIEAPDGRTDELATFGGPLTGCGPVAVLTAPGDALAGVAVEAISAWRAAGVDPGDIAVLARVNSALLPVQVACMESGVPCTTPLSASVLQRTGIRTAFAYLRIGADPDGIRREDVQETIRRPSRGIAPNVVDMLTGRSTTSIDDIRRLAGRLSGRDVPKLEAYATDLETVAKACGRSSAAALKAIRADIGLGETMDVLDGSRKEADRSTHTDDLTALESVAALHPEVTTFETWLREVLARTPLNGPSVLLSTVHRIKGREWGHVVIFGASRGLFPHRLGNDEEGERRVFHVALTRARTQVVALADAEAPSIFLAELDGSRVRASPSATNLGNANPDAGKSQRPSNGTGPGRKGPGARGGRGGGRRSAGAPREVRLPTVEATLGLVVEDRGSIGTIIEITAAAAVLSIGAARIKVALGSDVRVDGKSVTLVGPAAGVTGGMAGTTNGEQALRTWRSAMAHQDAVPAYVILKDTDLVAIAERDPRTLADLANCRGIGQIRLERWGDEILAILDAARSG
jgi:DNA helicase-2/ATP-dependent DNA helicase PcrA